MISTGRIATDLQTSTWTPWKAIDTVLLAVVTICAGALRYLDITQPGGFVFDEHYAADACLYLFGPSPRCIFTAETGLAHPPLGKWLIASGIELYGFNSAGWRLAPLAAGTLSVAVLYVLTRRVLDSTLAASIAAGLLALDFLHFVMSRVAMLDIFVVLFSLLSFLFLFFDRDRLGRDPSTGRGRETMLSRLVERRWLLAAGLAGGAAVAVKWSGGYLIAAVAGLAGVDAIRRRRGSVDRVQAVAREDGVAWIVAFVFLPAAIYVASYAGRLPGRLLDVPWSEGSWLHSFVARQQVMLAHHTGPLYVHPYMSPAWSWPFIKRPVLFFFREFTDGRYQEILAFGNPFVWWPAFLAVAALAWRLVRQRTAMSRESIVVAGFVAGYVPWLVITREESFLYYFLPAVPFMYVALADVVTRIVSKRVRATIICGLAAAAVGMFAFFWPLLAGRPINYHEWEQRIVLGNCGPSVSTNHKKPILGPLPPPTGWCWL